MPGFIGKTTRRPPQSLARIRQGHPLARGLIGAYSPYTANVKPFAAAVKKSGVDGLGFTVPTDADYWQAVTAGTGACVSVNPTWTVLVIVSNSGTHAAQRAVYCERPTGNQILKIEVNENSTSNDFGVLVLRDAGAVGLIQLEKGATGEAMLNGRSVITAVRRGTTSHQLYVNGKSVATNTATTVPNNFADCDAFIGHDAIDGTAYLEGLSTPLVLTWNRALTDGEVARISENPWQIFRSPDRLWGFPNLAAGGVALTGVAGTTSVGNLGPVLAKGLTGNAATGAAGTASAQVSGALTGNAGTGSPGTVAPSTSKALTGNAGTGTAGTVTGVTSKALTGNGATGSVGSVSATTSNALTGTAATGSAGTVAPSTTTALTGNSATGSAGSVAAAASNAITGNTGTGSIGTVGPAVVVALTGVSAAGEVGNVTASTPSDTAISGVQSTGQAGSLGPAVSKAITGNSATANVGTLTIALSAALTGAGVSATPGTLGLSISTALAGVGATGEVGDVTVQAGTDVALTGVQGTGQVSAPGVDITISIAGVSAAGSVGSVSVPGDFDELAAAIWGFVLSNGKTAGQNVVEIRAMLDLLTPGFWDFPIEGPYTAADLLRVIAAVQAGKSSITALGGGAATVEFRAVDDSEVRVTADMQGSERTEVTINAN